MGKIYSMLTSLRLTSGKISAVQSDKLTFQKLVKYAMRGNTLVQAAAENRIVQLGKDANLLGRDGNINDVSKLVEEVGKYLDSDKYVVINAKKVDMQSVWRVGGGNCWDYDLHEDARRYPERGIAQRILKRISDQTIHTPLKFEINMLLTSAKQVVEVVIYEKGPY